MAKLSVFLVILFLSVLSVFAFFNKGSVDVTIWNGMTYESVPLIALVLISTSIGIFTMFIVAAVRDVRRYLDSWQVQRVQKKEAQIEESYSKGYEAMFAERYEEAEELFTRVIGDGPEHVNALLRLGDIYYSKGDLRKASNFYQRAKVVKPRSIEALLSLSKVYEAQNKRQDAIKFIDTSLRNDSTPAPVDIGILHLSVAGPDIWCRRCEPQFRDPVQCNPAGVGPVAHDFRFKDHLTHARGNGG